jgi:murein DD-endopeptidase MepM/ murein hydrolase activator NlpD
MATSAFRKLGTVAVMVFVLSAHTTQTNIAHAQSDNLNPTWVDVARAPEQPPLLLPFAAEEKWWYSGGPHGAYGADGPFSAVDFAVPVSRGCEISHEWIIAAAPGVVTTSGQGEVTVDLDGDGDPSNSWSLFYFHMSDTDRIPVGTKVQIGDHIGRVDCEYGITNGSHLHFARRYKGAFVAVNNSVAPMDLSGWTFQSAGEDYVGFATHAEYGRLQASCCQKDSGLPSQITSNNNPATRLRVYNNPILAAQKFLFSLPIDWFKPDFIVQRPDLVDGFRDGRLVGKDGWRLPVASNVISSNEDDHTQCVNLGLVKTGRCSVNAWDLSAVQLAAVRAAAPGVVEYAGCNNAGNYGCWVWIKHPDGRYTAYAHLIDERDPSFKIPSGSDGDPQGYVMVKVGQQVDQSTVLGRVGMTGKTGWSHTHFEIRDANQKQERIDTYFDPKLMEYRVGGATKDWPWDEPYQGNNPMQSRPSLAYALALGPTLILLAILLLMGIVIIVPFRSMGKIIRYFVKSKKGSLKELWVRYAILYVQIMTLAFLFGMSVGALQMGALGFLRNYSAVTFDVSVLEKILGVSRTYEFEVPATGLFTPVWGWPCTNGGPGTLGNTCTEDQVVGAGKSWASAVESATGRSATPVVVPVLHSGFTMNQFVKLIPTAHANGTMVLLDTSGKVEDLRKGISQLTPFGLDGIVVDQEHNTALTFADVKQLAQEFARAREKAGLKGEGIVLVWDVFHSMGGSNADFGGVPGLRFVVINDGFGGSVAKWESLQKTRSHYGVTDNNRTGVMFFDRRWPVNSSCTSSNNTNGYDCQSWKAMLEIYPTLATLGWLAQQ